MAQKIQYNKEDNILSIRFGKARSVDSDINGNVVIDYDKNGKVVGLDIMKFNLSNFVPLRQWQKLAIEAR